MNKARMFLEVAQLVLDVVDDMRKLSDSVQAVCNTIVEGLSDEKPEDIKEEPVKKEEPTVTLEQVRGVLAEKSQAGFTSEVKAIIKKYGASRLSEIDPKDFKAVIKDAEGLGNE